MTQSDPPAAPPLQRFYDLSDLSQAGDEIVIAARQTDLPKLAEWLEVDEVERFEARVTLKRLPADRFSYEAELAADLVQACVVSLEPVKSRHALHVSRALHVKPRPQRRHKAEEESGGVLTLAAGDDEVPEELDSPRYDLAAPLLEDLSLDIDPYPRAPGVEFEPPDSDGGRPEGPFAALGKLKRGGR